MSWRTDSKLAALLPTLTGLVERTRVLIVIDNIESLLDQDRNWRDARWGRVVGALTAHSGLGRVILTSRHVPSDVSSVQVETVDALSADESLLLARELPNLNALIRGKIPGIDPSTARRLGQRALEAAQGHPKLLELADGQAARPENLAALLEAGEQDWRTRGGVPGGFFANGLTIMKDEDYVNVLAAWTSKAAQSLKPGGRDLFWFLCCLEQADRERHMVEGNWEDLWSRLGRFGDPPGWERAFASLADCSLASIRRSSRKEYLEKYSIHPAVAAAARAEAGAAFQNAVDEEAIAYWTLNFREASGTTGDGIALTDILVRAGLAVVPYMVRQQRWEAAALALDTVFLWNPTRSNAAAVLPLIRGILPAGPQSGERAGQSSASDRSRRCQKRPPGFP